MDSSPYARVQEDRIPMLRYRGERVTGQAEDLSQSLFFGFNSVLNGRDPRIDAARLIGQEPTAPSDVVDQSDAFFWFGQPQSLVSCFCCFSHSVAIGAQTQTIVCCLSMTSSKWQQKRFFFCLFLLFFSWKGTSKAVACFFFCRTHCCGSSKGPSLY